MYALSGAAKWTGQKRLIFFGPSAWLGIKFEQLLGGGGVSTMLDKLGALVQVPETAIVPELESCACKRERDIQIMFDTSGKNSLGGEFYREHYQFLLNVPKMSRKRHENVTKMSTNVPKMSQKCPTNVPKMTQK